MPEQVADLSNLVKIALVNDGKSNLDNWLANQLLQNKNTTERLFAGL